ncbi:hypothetical protein SAMN02745945_02231 [Peptoclostridium litorale DSM 5388]|uniref:ECF transporter S component n=1 Tax=Peptoclostridium litorale DSM 5388 TaxID=1121324 RepID=A0A069RFE5_PEPLI|nr:hypothetical protein [Peptoclostridium litorale]KDR95754.1 hypothetical protein CLIT_10c04810 [Peptoclostridium litorale DSM 5388]SIO21990.1 hypothetical protein SAMN02745945_02231 [Peptoclostridium litorale DSM 5388]
MKKKNYFIGAVFLIGLLLNIGTELGKIYWALPQIISSNIVGTVIMGAVGGPLWGGIGASASNQILANTGMGNPEMNIFFIVKMLEGIVVGFLGRIRKFDMITALLCAAVLALIVPFAGSVLAAYKFSNEEGEGLAYVAGVISSGGAKYVDMLGGRFIQLFSNYGFSCMVALPVVKMINKLLEDKQPL